MKNERHPLIDDERFQIDRTEGLLHLSRAILPKQCKEGTFSLKTLSAFKSNDETIGEGSYLIIDPDDRVVADGRMMIFFVSGMFDCRRCHVAECVWLEKPSKKESPPIILTKEDAYKACIGHVSMIMPVPA